MQLPTEGKIVSHRPVIGKLIVAYKKMVALFVAPYLRTVFLKEHEILEERFQVIDAKLRALDEVLATFTQSISKRTDAIAASANERIENATQDMLRRMDALTASTNERIEKTTQDILKRTDTLILTLDKKIENVIVREQQIAKELHATREQRRSLEDRFDRVMMQRELSERVLDISQEIASQKSMLDLLLSEIRRINHAATESKEATK